MSCKGIFPTTARPSGQLKDDNSRNVFNRKVDSSFINVQANSACHDGKVSSVGPSSPKLTQDVAQVSVDDNLSNCSTECVSLVLPDSNGQIALLEIPSSEICSDHGSDIGSLSVDDWFKPRTDSVSSLDLDAVSLMKAEGIDQSYMVDGNNFLTSKDNEDLCIVTNICNMGLELDLPISTLNSDKFTCVEDKDCTVATILHDYQEQDSLMNDFTSNNILDKHSILVDDAENLNQSTGSNECGITSNISSSICLNDLKDSDEHFSSSPSLESSSTLPICQIEGETEIVESQWSDSLEMPTNLQSHAVAIDCSTSTANWEDLERTSQNPSCEVLDTEQDFSEFNYLTFQADSNEGIIDALKEDLPTSQIERLNKSTTKSETYLKIFVSPELESASEKPKSPSQSCNQLSTIGPTDQQKRFSSTKPSAKNDLSQATLKSITQSKARFMPSKTLLKNSIGAIVSTPNTTRLIPIEAASMLSKGAKGERGISANSSLLVSSNTCRPNKSESKSDRTCQRNETPSMAMIAISTDKSKSTTEIIINTSHGEQVYKGKTIDFMKASTYVQVTKMDKMLHKKNKELKSEPMSSQTSESITVREEEDPLALSLSPEMGLMKDGTDMSATLLEPVDFIPDESTSDTDDFIEFAENSADQPVMEALAEIGITEDNLFRAKLASGKKFWVCPIGDCGKLYPSLSLLKTHILAHYGRRPYRCDYKDCHWSFYKYFKLKRHRETHEKRKDFECPKDGCGRCFTTVYNLKTHIKLHDRPAEMACHVDDCCARFQTKRDLEVHLKIHDREHAPYKCSFLMCGKTYYSANALNSHTRSHQYRDDELRCEYCDKLFDKPCRLKFHLRSHTGDKPYPCTFQGCGWAFTSSSKLSRHMYKHTNERKFKCTINNCNKSFMRSEHLKEHTLTHVHARSFACHVEGCGVKFQAKSSLYVHLKKHRDSTNPNPPEKVLMVCPIEQCNRTYTCKSSLRQHMLKFHTPVLAADASHLDYIALLTDGDDLGNLEGLQFATEMTANGAANSMASTIVHVTGPSTPETIVGDIIDSSSHNITNGVFSFQNVSPQHKFKPNGMVTHVVISPPETQVAVDPLQSISEPCQSTSSVMSIVRVDSNPSSTDDEKWTIGVVQESVKGSKYGSARTNYTLDDFLRDRAKKLAEREAVAVQGKTDQIGEHLELSRGISDVVLGTGTMNSQDITHSFLLQDDMPSNHFLYHEDQMMASGSGVGELQVLLLDSDEGTRQEFAESTINLRDLE